MKKEKLKEFIGQNQIDEVFIQLKSIVDPDSDLYDDLLVLENRYNINKNKIRKNTIDKSDSSRENSKIVESLLSIINDIPELEPRAVKSNEEVNPIDELEQQLQKIQAKKENAAFINQKKLSTIPKSIARC